MRFLEAGEMLCMLPAENRCEQQAINRLATIFERVAGDSERLQRLMKSGALRTAQVNIQGRPASVFWYRTEGERLIVDTIVSISRDKETLPVSVEGMKQVAAAHGCNQIEGCTQRRGVAEALQALDWYPVGVVLRKDC